MTSRDIGLLCGRTERCSETCGAYKPRRVRKDSKLKAKGNCAYWPKTSQCKTLEHISPGQDCLHPAYREGTKQDYPIGIRFTTLALG